MINDRWKNTKPQKFIALPKFCRLSIVCSFEINLFHIGDSPHNLSFGFLEIVGGLVGAI